MDYSDKINAGGYQLSFGPIDFDGLRLLPPHAIDTLEHLWFKAFLNEAEQRLLPDMLQVAEIASDSLYVLDLVNQRCCRCSHDPAGLFDWLPSFDDLIRMAVIDLSWSCYGWPDSAVEELATALKRELFDW